jgi:putative ferrous iron transport protein C
MSLLEIKKYLLEVKIASLAKIAAHFNCDAEVVRTMLTHWLRKGCIRKFTPEAGCGKTCMKCVPQTVEIYEWV